MNRFREKSEGPTKQNLGHGAGDDALTAEGQAQEGAAGRDRPEGEESGLQGPLDPPRGKSNRQPKPRDH